ncbi:MULTISPECIES: N-acetylneuraminate synthase family protein [unclassified Sulfurimonas]|uniref:N-acetylneuraminate synthase family protein n=1 Tax=unclassified Sulfurimonas TaxID=2623549 RepID=UPI000A9C3949|nr:MULTISPECIES: N-acetylneuraminate synthase family protein [unclassified Sulfurimonas]
MSIFIIAEVGINHNGSVEIAKKMIDEAKECGVDCVKFQTFKAEEFISDPNQTYTYISQDKEVTESMLDMFKRYEFSKDEWQEIIAYCKEKEIIFSSTAQNPSDLDFLLSLTKLPFIKVGSDDLTNLGLLKYYASKKIPMIISAGMSYASEIEDAVSAIKETKNEDITVLHCVSSYPAEAEEVNLKKIPTIRDAFGVKVGFSDHTIGSAAAVGSVCFGAKVIEKHFTLDTSMAGPDHRFSINPSELKKYVDDIRSIKKAIGTSELKPTSKELEMRKIARRSIVADVKLEIGDFITSKNVSFKRVQNDDTLTPKELKYILGREVKNKIEKNYPIKLKDLR